MTSGKVHRFGIGYRLQRLDLLPTLESDGKQTE